MRAAVLHGEHELPKYETVSDPVAGKHELLVKVEAIGVNYADTMIRRGFYLQKPQFPFIPGFEFSGTVVKGGDGVVQGWTGRRVMGFCQNAYAEYVVVPESGAIPVPEYFSTEEAAAFPVIFLTAYAMLKISARVLPGETILVHAAAGGVGTATVQLAKKMGLKVIATASSEEKLLRVKELGADLTINYRTGDFVQPVLDFTGKKGADIIFESIGGDFVDRDIDAAAPFGRIVVFGMASGSLPPPNVSKMFKNSVTIGAFWMFTLSHHPDLLQETVQGLLQLVAREGIHPIIGQVYPLSEASAALTSLESRGTYGKLLLKP